MMRLDRLLRAVADRPKPCALVDLEAMEANVDLLASIARSAKKRARLATKSLRSPALTRRVLDRANGAFEGLMTYDARETAFLASHGFDDFLLAYPTVQRADVDVIASLAREGKKLAVVVDAIEHLEALGATGANVSVIVDVDASYRPLGSTRVHLGVRRSPLHDVADVIAFVERARATKGVRFAGLMAYEAQIAGLGDDAAAIRAMKAASRAELLARRKAIVDALRSAGNSPAIFNGGGTGSLAWSSHDDALTEVTVGSGVLAPHLFDSFEMGLTPAAFFALQVVRRASSDVVTCHGGGFVASGGASRDRLPIPVFPEGVALLDREGAGEVQTPVKHAKGASIAIGDAVLFRHAKAGELAEHFGEYALVRGDAIEAEAKTYRGLGRTFLG